uniref:DUF4604 domain-containing protein n=1 Tax=Plectus sambesii TaxID=2011161 RepID=A0A914VX00_9BILA
MSNKSESKATYKQRQAISYTKPAEPAFLKQLKQKTGYREPATIDDKRAELPTATEDDDEQKDLTSAREEDRPQVVVLDPSKDLSQEQVDKVLKKQEDDDEKQKIDEGKITFKKPLKRDAQADEKKDDSKRQRSIYDDPRVEKKDVRLLSFADDEEDV